MPHATLRQVAAASGASLATVSRVANDDPHVAVATRQRVRAAMRRLGWRPDPAVRALAAYRWPGRGGAPGALLACLRDRYSAGDRRKDAMLRREAAVYGFTVQPVVVSPATDWAELGSRLLAQGVVAAVLDVFDDEVRVQLPWDRLHGVVLGEGQAQLSLPRVSTDWRAAFDAALERTRRHGRRTGIVLRAFAGANLTRELRAEALIRREELIRELGPQPPILQVPASDPAAASRAAAVWWRKHRPEAVVADGAVTLAWLQAAGMRCPRDAAFATVIRRGDEPLTIAGCDVDLAGRMRCAVEHLHAAVLRQPDVDPDRRLVMRLPPRWHAAASCPEG